MNIKIVVICHNYYLFTVTSENDYLLTRRYANPQVIGHERGGKEIKQRTKDLFVKSDQAGNLLL